jgi:hypothetical protein
MRAASSDCTQGVFRSLLNPIQLNAIWHAPGYVNAQGRGMGKCVLFCCRFVLAAQNEVLVNVFEVKVPEHVQTED